VLKLYFAPGSSSMAPHIALHEIGVPFESGPISFAKKENRTPAYLAINPEGTVPTLLIDGRRLTEVAAILFYLARRFPEADLLPIGDMEAEAQAISWMSFIAATIHPARRQGLERSKEVFAIAEQRLGQRDWALGRYSIADTSVSPVLALRELALARARDLPESLRPLRPHDGAPRGATNVRNRSSNRL
jgi:glutathione S-transferase